MSACHLAGCWYFMLKQLAKNVHCWICILYMLDELSMARINVFVSNMQHSDIDKPYVWFVCLFLFFIFFFLVRWRWMWTLRVYYLCWFAFSLNGKYYIVKILNTKILVAAVGFLLLIQCINDTCENENRIYEWLTNIHFETIGFSILFTLSFI